MDIMSVNNTLAITAQTEIQKQQAKVDGFQSVLDKAVAEKDAAELKKACQEVEGYFIQLMFKEMRKTINKSGSFIPQSKMEEVFTDFLDEEIAKNASSTGRLGIADMMYKQLSRGL